MMFYSSIRLVAVVGILSAACISTGCTGDDQAKESLHDHFVSAHWPDDLDDLSKKLRRRIAFLRDPDSVDAMPDDHSDHEHGDHEHGDHEHGDHDHGDHDHGDHHHGNHEHGDHHHGDHHHGAHGHSHSHSHKAPAKPLTADSAVAEIRDLVGWVSEIAADTNMSEKDWIPFNESSQSIGKELESVSASTISDSLLSRVEKLCDEIDSISQKLQEKS